MKNSRIKIFILLVMMFLLLEANSQIGLLKVSSNTFTPNSTDTIGAFARIYYHTARQKFYLVYAARLWGQTTPAGRLNNFTWVELDTNLVTTGSRGTLAGQGSSAGDFAMVMVDSNFYHLTVGGSSALDYKLTKYDKDFTLKSSTTIDINTCESNIDQEMNYTNSRLVIGAMYDATFCPPTNPPDTAFHSYTRIYQYDTSLTAVKSPVLLDTPSKVTWGASIIYRNGYYYEVTMEHFKNRDLYAYKYDSNFNYINRTLLNSDGQWSQGVLWDGSYYYVAHHTLDHNHGNVLLSVYDSLWSLITTKNVTTYAAPSDGGPPMSSSNANRPFIIKVGTKIYISYDVETYILNANQKDWQAHVDVYQINYALPTIFKQCGLSVKNNNRVEIGWQTSTETNVKEYIIQKSIDGSKFMFVGRVNAQNNTALNKYAFIDEVNNWGVDKVYYRIVSVENDGSKSYSKTMTALLDKSWAGFSIFPNPVKDRIYLSSNINLNGERAEIIEISGKKVADCSIENNSVYLKNLSKGFYLMKINTSSGLLLQRFIVD